MGLDSVLGQEHVASLFRRILNGGRLAHAYAFAGPPGVGKALFARELSKALICREQPSEGCQLCARCERIDKDAHPDVHWYRPPEGKRIFPIEVIRNGLIPEMSLKSLEGGYKIFVMEQGEMMNEEAANCLLKTLEEPPEKSLLVLITEAADRLLPTIYSRCLIVRFRPIPPDIMKAELIARLGVDESYADCLTRLSGGSFGTALRLHESHGIDEKNSLIDSWRNVKATDNFNLAAELIDSAPSGTTLEVARTHLKQCLDFMLYFYRDALLVALTGKDSSAVNTDRLTDIAVLSKSLPPEQIQRAIEAILQAQQHLYMNVNMNLLLENLFHTLGKLR